MAKGDVGTNHAWYNARKARNRNIVTATGAFIAAGVITFLGYTFLDNYKPFLDDVRKNREVSELAYKQSTKNEKDIESTKKKFKQLQNKVSSNNSGLELLQEKVTKKHNQLESRLVDMDMGIHTFKGLDIDYDGKNDNVRYFPVANVLIPEGKAPINAYEWAMQSLQRVEDLGSDACIGDIRDVIRFYQIMAGDANLNIEADTMDELRERYSPE